VKSLLLLILAFSFQFLNMDSRLRGNGREAGV